jgi:ferredoxin-NADP reductase
MEWTLPHPFTDRRGARRFFTVSSSPKESETKIGVKFSDAGSSFKQALLSMAPGSKITATNVSGGFTLPKNDIKLCFIAGGIGITPYASIIKYLIENKEKRDIVLIYSNSREEEISYRELFDEAVKNLRVKVIYTLSDIAGIDASWEGRTGRIDKEMIEKEVPDYKDRLFYVSGSKPLIDGAKGTLKQVGIPSKQIKTDYFPGYA